MKKYRIRWISLLTAVALVFTIAACQATPDKEIVQNKNDHALMDEINAATSDDADVSNRIPDEEALVYNVAYESIDYVKFEDDMANRLQLQIDADFLTPDMSQFPVVEYRRKVFTQKEVDEIITALIGDEKLYDFDIRLTKSEIEALIIQTKYDYETMDSPAAIGVKNIDELHQERDEILEDLYEELEEAPEASQASEISTTLNKNGILVGKARLDNNKYANLRISSGEERQSGYDNDTLGVRYSITGTGSSGELSRRLRELRESGELKSSDADDTAEISLMPVEERSDNIELSPEQAVEIAKDIFETMGAGNDISVTNIYYLGIPKNSQFTEDICCYGIELKRYINGAPIKIVMSSNEGMEKRTNDTDDVFNAGVPYEMMTVFISDEGIIDLEWREPIEAVETLNSNVTLADTSEILEVFKQEFKNAYSYTDRSNLIPPIKVYEIKMDYGLARIPNEKNVYMAIPLWDFYAKIMFEDMLEAEGEAQNVISSLDMSLLTINGVDATRFSREWGY